MTFSIRTILMLIDFKVLTFLKAIDYSQITHLSYASSVNPDQTAPYAASDVVYTVGQCPVYGKQGINPLYTGGLFHWYMVDESVCHFRGV